MLPELQAGAGTLVFERRPLGGPPRDTPRPGPEFTATRKAGTVKHVIAAALAGVAAVAVAIVSGVSTAATNDLYREGGKVAQVKTISFEPGRYGARR